MPGERDPATVATAVATAAAHDGVARTSIDHPVQQLTDAMWPPSLINGQPVLRL
jgi:hypothetical protein